MTEMLFAIGAGELLVGATRFCDTPEAAKRIPRIGGFLDPNIEKILKMKPDLVVATKNSGNFNAVRKLEALGLAVYWSRVQTAEDIFGVLRHLGQLTGRAHAANRRISAIRSAIKRYRLLRPAKRPRLRVLIIYGHRPLVAAGPGSYGDELLTLAGADNVLHNSRVVYPTLGPEMVFRLKPDVIIDAYMGPKGNPRVLRRFWSRFTTLRAVRTKRLYFATNSLLLRPGPRVHQAVGWLTERLK